MTTFDKREEGFEKKFAHDEELRFKANARRNKLLGLWAAEIERYATGDATIEGGRHPRRIATAGDRSQQDDPFRIDAVACQE